METDADRKRMTGGRKMDEERQETADWRIVWQMFFPCVISDLIGGLWRCWDIWREMREEPCRRFLHLP